MKIIKTAILTIAAAVLSGGCSSTSDLVDGSAEYDVKKQRIVAAPAVRIQDDDNSDGNFLVIGEWKNHPNTSDLFAEERNFAMRTKAQDYCIHQLGYDGNAELHSPRILVCDEKHPGVFIDEFFRPEHWTLEKTCRYGQIAYDVVCKGRPTLQVEIVGGSSEAE